MATSLQQFFLNKATVSKPRYLKQATFMRFARESAYFAGFAFQTKTPRVVQIRNTRLVTYPCLSSMLTNLKHYELVKAYEQQLNVSAPSLFPPGWSSFLLTVKDIGRCPVSRRYYTEFFDTEPAYSVSDMNETERAFYALFTKTVLPYLTKKLDLLNHRACVKIVRRDGFLMPVIAVFKVSYYKQNKKRKLRAQVYLNETDTVTTLSEELKTSS